MTEADGTTREIPIASSGRDNAAGDVMVTMMNLHLHEVFVGKIVADTY